MPATEWANKRPPPSPIVAPPAKVLKLEHRHDDSEDEAAAARPDPAAAAVQLPDLHDTENHYEEEDAAVVAAAAREAALAQEVKVEDPLLPSPELPALPVAPQDEPAVPLPTEPHTDVSPLPPLPPPGAHSLEALGAALARSELRDGAVAAAAMGAEDGGEWHRVATSAEGGGPDEETIQAMDGTSHADPNEATAAPVNVGDESTSAAPPNDDGVATDNIKPASDEAAAVAAAIAKVNEVANIVMDQFDDSATATIAAAEPSVKKAKKERREFTAHEKLQILAELNGPNAPPVSAILEKYSVSKSSLHRWRQPEKIERLQEMVTGALGQGAAAADTFVDKSKKRDMHDKLRQIKLGLRAFCKENLTRPGDERLAITSGLLQFRAGAIKDELLRQHEEVPGLLTDEEAAALRAFKGSKSWACLVGNQLGYLSSAPVAWTDAQRENTTAHLEIHARRPVRPKKRRMEFTAQEKLVIVQEFESANLQNKADGARPLTVAALCTKYHTSKSSFHRWKQQASRLRELAAVGSGYARSKRVFADKLHAIKRALHEFYVENETAPAERRVPVNYPTLQARALLAKEEILEHHRRTVAAATRAAATHGRDEVEGVHLIEVKASDGTPAAEDHGGEGMHGVEVKADEGAGQAEVPVGEGAPQVEVKVGEGTPQVEAEEFAPVLKVQVDEGHEGGEGCAVKAEDGNGQTENAPNGSCDGITMSKEEIHAVENFKASNSWLRETARKFGWKLDDAKDAAPVETAAVYPPPEQHPRVEYTVAELQAMAPEQPRVEHQGAQDLAMAPILAGDVHQDQVQNGVVEGHLQGNNDHPQQQQPQAEQVLLAPAAYDAQGSAMVEMLDASSVQVELNDATVDI